MNIIESITKRAEKAFSENKQALKNYSTQERAEKATAKAAMELSEYFTLNTAPRPVVSARYIVLHIPGINRWIGALDMTELLSRRTSTGGYLGVQPGFIKF